MCSPALILRSVDDSQHKDGEHLLFIDEQKWDTLKLDLLPLRVTLFLAAKISTF